MSEEMVPPEKQKKTGRPTGSTNKPKRNDYASDLRELQAKVDFALKLLKKGDPSPLIDIAIETLENK